MFKLIIQDDEGKTTVVPLIRDEITIGRKEGNTIRLTERNVSRKHARIVKSNGSVVVEDLDSYNGVKVNGTRIQGRVAVNESDRIQIGDYLLELKLDRGNQAVEGAPGSISQDGAAPMLAGATAAHTPPPVLGANGAAAAALRANKPTTPLPPAAPPSYESIPPAAPPVAAPAAIPGSPGRLVVVSSNFGGREFVLSKPTMVIGRTDDNDIVVNHRSISRHHAKVVLEQGRYCIVDQQSSNGVRVNGEEYGKVELRRGDVIDLGHVRLRYVDPGEDFVFDRDAQIVDISQKSGSSKGVVLALLSVAVIGGAAAVFLITTTHGPTTASSEPPKVAVAAAEPAPQPAAAPTPPAAAEPASAKPAPAVAAAPTPAASSDAGTMAASPTAPPQAAEPAVKPAAAPAADDAAKLLGEAKAAAAAEDWLKAYAAAEKALAADPANAEAKKLEDQAHAEVANQLHHKRFVEARDGGRVTDAMKELAQIPKDSVYRAKAEADVPALHEQFVKSREGEARGLAAKGQCDKIATLARRSGEVFPDAKAAVEKAGAHCVAEPRAEVAAPAPSPAAVDTDTLIAEARDAAKNANWIEARKKADEVLRRNPDNQDALSVAAVAACNLSDRDRAVKYIGRLRGDRQNMLKQICVNRGVSID